VSGQLLLADNRYRDRLLTFTTREGLDKWFSQAAHCFMGGSCFDCCAFEDNKCSRNPAKSPFCTAFDCGDCGCDCSKEDFGWLQDLMEKTEAEGVWR
jgi:hypothetical protein